MRLIAATLCLCVPLGSASAQAGNSFLTADGINRAPAAVLHCVGAGNIAAPCGTASQPVFVAGASGLATSSNQQSQIQSGQAVATAAGTPGDAIYTSGSGSFIAILKGVFTALTGGVTALPVMGTPTSRSTYLAALASTAVFPANSARHYLALQAPLATSIWVNFVGGAASPNGADCIQLSAGVLYESGQFVTRGQVTVYAPVAVTIAAWEG